MELKNGETLNGVLTNCDSWMNLTLSDVIQTSPNGEEFTKVAEIYIRGNHIKYLRLPEQVCITKQFLLTILTFRQWIMLKSKI